MGHKHLLGDMSPQLHQPFSGVKSGAGVPVSAALGAMCAATPAASLAKFVVLSTTSGNIARKQIRERFQGMKG
jgi:hypothetical protein